MSDTIVNIITLHLIDLLMSFVSSISKIRTIIVLMLIMKKIFRKKITVMISIMNIYTSTISSNSNRVKRSFSSFISSIIFFIKIVFIRKISQIFALNNKNRRRQLKSISNTKEVFRSKNSNHIDKLILCH